MQCVRCGAIFEGRFCPRCGAPAMAAAPAPPDRTAAPMGWPCPRCGTLFRGNFCPRCGLPTAAWAYRPPAAPSGGRTVLSVLWTIALVGFIIFVITDFAALVAAPAYVVPGIQAIGSGQTVNSGFGFDAGNWIFDPLGTDRSGHIEAPAAIRAASWRCPYPARVPADIGGRRSGSTARFPSREPPTSTSKSALA